MSFYSVDFDLLIKRLLPTQKRDTWHLEWLASIIKGVKNIYDDFTTFKTETLRQLSLNSQKLLFEKAINDDVDSTLKRIYIDNSADDLEDSYFYQLSEGQDDAFCYKLTEEPFSGRYMYSIREYLSPYDFTVFVPTALINEVEKIKAIVNFYKLAGKRYLIELF